MKVIVIKSCGGLSPATRIPFALAPSDEPVTVEDAVGAILIKSGFATRVKTPAKKAPAKKVSA